MSMNWSKHSKVIVGSSYGRLLVVSRLPNNKHGGAMYECQCECGTTFNTYGAGLSSRLKTQCGKCGAKPHLDRLHEARRLDPGKAAKHATFLQTKRSAVIRSIGWQITESEFHEIAQKPCHYCGTVQSNCKKGKYGLYGEYRYNGIDRMNSNRGYVAGNMVPCCWQCNRAKCNNSVEEFLSWARRLVQHQSHRS